MAGNDRHDIAMFIDFENIAIGLRGRTDQNFDVKKVLERLLEKGKIIVKRAYADWSRFSAYTRPFHEAAIELIEVPRTGIVGKNSVDIRMCVDAMDMCYAKEHIDTFVVVSGDSDFSPLVSKLKENGKRVIGLGLRGSTSNLLVSNCDEFIFYETLEPRPVSAEQIATPQGKEEGIMALVASTIEALIREGRDPIQASLVKDTIRRKQPSFNESDYGYRSFTTLLEEAQAKGILTMREDPRSGTFSVALAKGAASAREKPASAAPREQAPARRVESLAAKTQPAPLPTAPSASQAEKPAAEPKPARRRRTSPRSGAPRARRPRKSVGGNQAAGAEGSSGF